MSTYYIIDTTLGNKPLIFENVTQVVKHLEGTVQRKFRQTRKQYMQNLIDLGYGYDDPQGKVFTQSLSEHFNIGVVNGNSLKKCNIHEVSQYSKYRNEMGD
jgi:hypothetical protein